MSTTKKQDDKTDGGTAHTKKNPECSLEFSEVPHERLLDVLDAVAWLTCPDLEQVSQFADLESKTAAMVAENARILGLLDVTDDGLYTLVPPYPFGGTIPQKRTVVREWMLRMPLLVNVRQFLAQNEPIEAALRKAAAVQRIENFDPEKLAPLLSWAKNLHALEPDLGLEDLYEDAAASKKERNNDHPKKRVVFLSRCSKDDAVIRQLATDLGTEGVSVWLHDQRVRPLESAAERMAQGLVVSDYLLLGMSRYSVEAPWIKKELNELFFDEIARREIRIVPLKLDDCLIPKLLIDMGFVDFSISYKDGLRELMTLLENDLSPIPLEPQEIVSGSIVAPLKPESAV